MEGRKLFLISAEGESDQGQKESTEKHEDVGMISREDDKPWIVIWSVRMGAMRGQEASVWAQYVNRHRGKDVNSPHVTVIPWQISKWPLTNYRITLELEKKPLMAIGGYPNVTRSLSKSLHQGKGFAFEFHYCSPLCSKTGETECQGLQLETLNKCPLNK